MEGDFLLNKIAAEGQAANADFERRLKTAPPLEILLECPDEADELQKMMQDMERQFSANAGNPFGDAHTFDVEKAATSDAAPSIAELEAKYPENPWGSIAKREPATQHQDAEEETDPPELPEQTGTVRERRVESMKGSILARMQDGASRATAVAELLKIAGNSTYSRQIVRDAETQTADA